MATQPSDPVAEASIPVPAGSEGGLPTVDRTQGGPVVVLDEGKLDEPLEAAIRRVREDPTRRRARILVVGPEDEVCDDGGAGPVLTPRPSERARSQGRNHLLWVQIEEAVQRVGRSWLAREEIMSQWVREAKVVAAALDQALRDGAGVARQAGRISEICDWLDCTVRESCYEARKTSQGMEVRSTAALIRDAASEIHESYPELALELPDIVGSPQVYGQSFALYQAFLLAFEAVAERIGREGNLSVEVDEGNFYTLHRFLGEAADPDVEPGEIPRTIAERLDHLVRERHQGRIFPARGSEAGLVLAFPNRRLDAPLGA